MDKILVLKAIANDSRMTILELLLEKNYCVGMLARKLELTEGAISQHLKVLREVGLLNGEKKGYFMHYEVNREILLKLADEIKDLALVEQKTCQGEELGKGEKDFGHKGHCNCHQSK